MAKKAATGVASRQREPVACDWKDDRPEYRKNIYPD